MIYLFPLPFIFELFYDRYRISRKLPDLHWSARTLMIVAVSTESITWSPLIVQLNAGVVALSCALYCFFDPVLNKLLGHPWYYQGENGKVIDNALKRLDPYWVLTIRILCFFWMVWFGVMNLE